MPTTAPARTIPQRRPSRSSRTTRWLPVPARYPPLRPDDSRGPRVYSPPSERREADSYPPDE
ncbi:hypothetical protein BJF79_31365 [Actinomadura sp. CNU-125]|nr:hypothetical protein BJF79_31365 [Actinomadura sp. CNU-125]